jgi:hypothetical protein
VHGLFKEIFTFSHAAQYCSDLIGLNQVIFDGANDVPKVESSQPLRSLKDTVDVLQATMVNHHSRQNGRLGHEGTELVAVRMRAYHSQKIINIRLLSIKSYRKITITIIRKCIRKAGIQALWVVG